MSNYKRYYLKEYYYVFITIVTYERKNILIENIELLKQSFKNVLSKYNFEIIAICVLPNHLHMIIKEKELKNFSKIVGSIKKYFSYNLNKNLRNNVISISMKKRKEAGIWQRRFYEHIIRNEKDLKKHLDYIHYNSFKHYKIAPKNWQYSSFSRFVKSKVYELDWCSFDFDDMNME